MLSALVEDYIAKRGPTVQPGTMQIWKLTQKNLLSYFGKSKPLQEVTPGDAEDFRANLIAGGLMESTTRKRCATASMFFKYALKHRIIESNPFEDIPKANMATKDLAYISRVDARKILEQLSNTEWRLLFALSRWGGLRVGSEVRRLKWADINWSSERFTVHSPKTARYAGHESRVVPMFAELATLFTERYEEAEEGDEYVLPMLIGKTDAAIRKPLLQAIKLAGVKQWPRLWHNMRSTRQTELSDSHPGHVVCASVSSKQGRELFYEQFSCNMVCSPAVVVGLHVCRSQTSILKKRRKIRCRLCRNQGSWRDTEKIEILKTPCFLVWSTLQRFLQRLK